MSAPAPRPHPRRRPTAVVVTGLLAWLLLPAAVAGAHPFVAGGGELPVDSLARITLQIAHGCGAEGDGEGADTREVALEVPDWLRVVEVAGHDGYDHDVEVSDGRTAVVTWRDAGEPEPAPAFELAVVADSEAGETRYLRVFQGCDDTSYRWIGTPDDPADDPAIRVELTAADPDRPAPPPEEVVEPEPEAQPDTDESADEEPDDDAADDATDDPADDPQVGVREDPDPAANAAEDASDGSLARWLIPALVAAAVIGLGVGSARHRLLERRNHG